MKILRTILGLALLFWLGVASASAQTPAPKPRTHALMMVVKVVAAPVAKPKRTLKMTLGTVLFAVESGVDVAHGGLSIADKAFDAIGVAGKVPVVDAVYAVVGVAATDSGKADLWLERQETYLFGHSN